MVWVTIKFTAPRQYVNFLACTADHEAKSELRVADGKVDARDLRWVVVAISDGFVVFFGWKRRGVGCGLVSS